MSDSDGEEVRVFGPGLCDGKTGKKSYVYFSGLPVNTDESSESQSSVNIYKDLTFTFEGPKIPEMFVDYERLNEDGNIEGYFVPLMPGDYKLSIFCHKNELGGSPFSFKVTGKPVSAEKLISKVRVYGKGSSLGRALVVNEFLVDCSKVKPVLGGLTVHVKGPVRSSAHLEIIDNRNGTYNVLYKPILAGVYNMDIKIADTHIPGSPYKIRVMDRSNSVY